MSILEDTKLCTTNFANEMIEDCMEIISQAKLGEFSWANLVKSIKLTIEHVDDVKGLTPQGKKDLVIAVAKTIIDRDHGPLDKFDDIFKPLIAATIDELLEVHASGLKLRKQEMSVGGCMSFCASVSSRCIEGV